tara:strand:+ start:36 stop:434 length:399 start_codon:yes stop_codon:yes gene_type:complete
MQGIGPVLPLSRDSQFGYYSLHVTYKDQVEQNFKTLMLTAPGERIMNPDFGVGLRHFLFEQKILVVPRIKQRIHNQVRKYMPYVKINRLLFDSRNNQKKLADESMLLTVIIEYEVPDFNLETELILQAEDIN